MPAFKGVRHFVYEKALMRLIEEAGFLRKGTGKDVLFITVATMVPWSVYQGLGNTALYLGGRVVSLVHTPYVKPGTAPPGRPSLYSDTSTTRVRVGPSSRPAARNYGIARIGGGIHSPFLGAFTFAPVILTGAGMFQAQFGRDSSFDAV